MAIYNSQWSPNKSSVNYNTPKSSVTYNTPKSSVTYNTPKSSVTYNTPKSSIFMMDFKEFPKFSYSGPQKMETICGRALKRSCGSWIRVCLVEKIFHAAQGQGFRCQNGTPAFKKSV
ncbi:hypothetical protein Avbf_06275 [Armadillidium vulgare]|nr:hypothetical protein Avbf_06275 [Armadillidium vulgare]